MDKIHEPHLLVQWANLLFGSIVESARLALHLQPTPPGQDVIPDFLVMSALIFIGFVVLGSIVRARLSVDNPSRWQVVLEDLVLSLQGMLDEYIGPSGRKYLPLVSSLGGYILVGNYLGLVPGFMAPTSNINVTLGCAITTWVYYHIEGVRTQGLWHYMKHFAGPPGVPAFMIPIMLVIEIISHAARVVSLTLRLFGNIFGEELVILILGMLVPLFIPMPIMLLSLITGGLQAFIFVLLTVIYLQGAVVVEHAEAHGHDPHAPLDEAVPA
jgi:F-type H+-transporting ATPase subunit a